MRVVSQRPNRRDRSQWRLNCMAISRLPLLRSTDLIPTRLISLSPLFR
jgi:hypothetical protein